jgi:hypothetical protein
VNGLFTALAAVVSTPFGATVNGVCAGLAGVVSILTTVTRTAVADRRNQRAADDFGRHVDTALDAAAELEQADLTLWEYECGWADS